MAKSSKLKLAGLLGRSLEVDGDGEGTGRRWRWRAGPGNRGRGRTRSGWIWAQISPVRTVWPIPPSGGSLG